MKEIHGVKVNGTAYDAILILDPITGTKGQKKWAESLRARGIYSLWEQGFHGTTESFQADCKKLPTNADWWIENKDCLLNAQRLFLGFRYLTLGGSNY